MARFSNSLIFSSVITLLANAYAKPSSKYLLVTIENQTDVPCDVTEQNYGPGWEPMFGITTETQLQPGQSQSTQYYPSWSSHNIYGKLSVRCGAQDSAQAEFSVIRQPNDEFFTRETKSIGPHYYLNKGPLGWTQSDNGRLATMAFSIDFVPTYHP